MNWAELFLSIRFHIIFTKLGYSKTRPSNKGGELGEHRKVTHLRRFPRQFGSETPASFNAWV